MKPNKEQAIYLAAVLQTLAVGEFTVFGVPQIQQILAGVNLPDSFGYLLVHVLLYLALSMAGYAMLSDKAHRKD